MSLEDAHDSVFSENWLKICIAFNLRMLLVQALRILLSFELYLIM